MNTTQKANASHLYERITAQIVSAMEKGQKEFQMPWHQSTTHVPKNASTGKRYRGINILALWASAMVREYDSPYWATYRQWAGLDAQVRRGEKASLIVFYKQIPRGESTAADEVDGSGGRWVARASWVFNETQVDGWRAKDAPEPDGNRVDALTNVESFVAEAGATVIESGDRAFYRKRPGIPPCAR